MPTFASNTLGVSHTEQPFAYCSFDILKDDLGGPRSTFPHCMYVVAGTQAQHAKENYVALMRLSEINQGRHGSKARNEDDDEMSDSDDEDAPPQIHTNRIAHHGGVNRLRCMPQQPAVVASWGDTGLVQVSCLLRVARCQDSSILLIWSHLAQLQHIRLSHRLLTKWHHLRCLHGSRSCHL